MSWQSPNPTENMTRGQVIRELFVPIATSIGVSKDNFLERLGSGWNTAPTGPFVHVRTAWKYGAARGVSGTPTYVANGAFSDDLSGRSVADWEAWIRGALPTTAQ